MVCKGSRMRAVYRMTLDGPLRWLRRWLTDLDLRPESHGTPVAQASWEQRELWLRSPCTRRLPRTLLVRSLLWEREGARANGPSRRWRGAVPRPGLDVSCAARAAAVARLSV
jgi:hypothetical protein